MNTRVVHAHGLHGASCGHATLAQHNVLCFALQDEGSTTKVMEAEQNRWVMIEMEPHIWFLMVRDN